MKKCEDCPKIPTVPGPVISARTLTNENAPLMTPNPNPDTAVSPEMLITINENLVLGFTAKRDSSK